MTKEQYNQKNIYFNQTEENLPTSLWSPDQQLVCLFYYLVICLIEETENEHRYEKFP